MRRNINNKNINNVNNQQSIVIMGRTNSGKTQFLKALVETKNQTYTLDTNQYKKTLKVYGQQYNFKFVDTRGFVEDQIVAQQRFPAYLQYNYFIVMFILSQIKSHQTAIQYVKLLLNQNKRADNILVVGNIHTTEQNNLETRQIYNILYDFGIKYIGINVLQKQNPKICIEKIVDKINLNRLNQTLQIGPNATIPICLLGQKNSGKTKIIDKMLERTATNPNPTLADKIQARQATYKDTVFIINFNDTPGLDLSVKDKVVRQSRYKDKQFHIIVIDLSNEQSLKYLQEYLKLMNEWKKTTDSVLIIGNKADILTIQANRIKRILRNPLYRKYQFNYVEIQSKSDKPNHCLKLILDLYMTDKIKQFKNNQRKNQLIKMINQKQNKKKQIQKKDRESIPVHCTIM